MHRVVLYPLLTLHADALSGLGYKLEEIYTEEMDAALGNGGLGTFY